MSSVKAVCVVTATFDDLGDTVFQYDLLLDNTSGSAPLSGLAVKNGDRVFGIDANSIIGAPQSVSGKPGVGWGFSASIPSLSAANLIQQL